MAKIKTDRPDVRIPGIGPILKGVWTTVPEDIARELKDQPGWEVDLKKSGGEK